MWDELALKELLGIDGVQYWTPRAVYTARCDGVHIGFNTNRLYYRIRFIGAGASDRSLSIQVYAEQLEPGPKKLKLFELIRIGVEQTEHLDMKLNFADEWP